MQTTARILTLASFAFVVPPGVGACSASPEPVRAAVRGTGVKIAGQASSVGDASQIEALDGVYGDHCTGRKGSWSMPVGQYGGPLDHSLLSVVEDDGPGCVLAVTAMRIAGTTYLAEPAFLLGSTYGASPSGFGDGAFHANFRITPADFSADFAIDMVLSDEVSVVTSEATAWASCDADLDTDPNNCGACGNVCGTGNVCVHGACTACGGEGQACCTGQSCNEGLSCDGKACAACDVACASGDRVACGAALKEALGGGGKIRVCPGEYEGPFPLTANVEIIGSGSGNEPAVDTILVGKAGLGSVVPVTSAITAVLDSLRITGGNGASSNSGGVYVNKAGAVVTINGCALVGNTGSYGGGASVYSGELTITDSEISDNTAINGGGIATATKSTITSTRITGNTASNTAGGVFVNSGTSTLGADVTIAGNTANGGAGTGGGIYKFTASATINNSASVTNNAPDNCAGNGFTCP